MRRAEPYPTWTALGWFAVLRLLLAFGLDLAFVPSLRGLWGAPSPLPLTTTVALVYSILALLGALSTYVRWPPKEQQVQIAVFLDIVAFTLLMHAGGGVASGLGLLLAITVAAGALLLEGRLSLLFASFAALAVLAQQVFSQLYLSDPGGSLTQAGLLGVTFFTVALLGHVLYRRIQEAEAIAARRQVDIDDLSKLNEYIIQSMGTGVLAVDGERNLRLINAAAAQLLGTARAAPGDGLTEIAPELSDWFERNIASASQHAGTLRIQEREVRATLRRLGNYRSSGALIFLRDNQELVREAHQMKLASLGRLTASIAHNIRNPLSSVGHAGQLLAESPALTSEDLRLLDIVRRNTHRIDEIVESVLALSRRSQAEPREIDLAVWLPELCADFRETHGLGDGCPHLAVGKGGLRVSADPRHLHQIFANLLDNALRHGGSEKSPPQIELRAYRDAVRGTAVAEVVDDGPGVAPETASEIFDPFFTTSASGTGLGLYIAKELSETNGIDLEYIPGEPRGSRFRLAFPA